MRYETCSGCEALVRQPEKDGTSRHVGISQEVYADLLALSQQTGRNMRWPANRLLAYAMNNVQIEE